MANADPKLSHIVAEPIGTSLEEEIFSKPGVVSLAWKGKRVRVNRHVPKPRNLGGHLVSQRCRRRPLICQNLGGGHVPPCPPPLWHMPGEQSVVASRVWDEITKWTQTEPTNVKCSNKSNSSWLGEDVLSAVGWVNQPIHSAVRRGRGAGGWGKWGTTTKLVNSTKVQLFWEGYKNALDVY